MRGAAAGVRRAPVLLTNKVPVTSTTCVHGRRRNTERAAPTPETIDGRRGAGRAEGEEAQHRPNVENMSGVMRSMYATLYCKHVLTTMPKDSTSWESHTRKNASS